MNCSKREGVLLQVYIIIYIYIYDKVDLLFPRKNSISLPKIKISDCILAPIYSIDEVWGRAYLAIS